MSIKSSNFIPTQPTAGTISKLQSTAGVYLVLDLAMRIGCDNIMDALTSRVAVLVAMLLLGTAAGCLRPDGRVGGCCHQQRSSQHSWSTRAVPEDGGSRSSVHSPGAVLHRLRGAGC